MKPRRLTLFALMTLALAAAIFASFRLPIMYKAIAPPVAIMLYLFVTVILFDLARTPKWLNVAILILLIAAVYLLFPTIYYVKFVDSQPIEGILIAGEQVHTGEKVFAIVPRGIYLLQYTGKYRESLIQQKNTIFNPLPVIKTITLKPGTFAYSSTKFYEPYKQKELFPSVVVRGKDIDGNPVELNGDTNTRIPFGTYTIGFDTQYFSETRRIKPETYYEQEIILNPNKNTIVLSYEEAEWVRNYVKEYLDLSARRIITEGGFPRQYHIYTKNYTLSLGDMLFIVCQMSQQEQPVYYSPKNMNYVKG
ncbi:hypothetical protein KY329_02180, partial [Candidatus Woesearchaeota archaeon]|nr:hypothetical protein [Candidatus Woesearchaeota archaeon]